MSTITLTGHILKELPAGIAKTDDSFWGIATVENVDTDGDIIRVEGIDTDKYHKPPERYMKVLINHTKMLPDGGPSITGRVEEFRKSEVDGVPALLFRGTWAKDGDGKLTKIAKAWKDLYDGGYLDSFSIGGTATKVKKLAKGNDVQQMVLTEISWATVQANAASNRIVTRTLKEMGIAMNDDIDTTVAKADAVADTGNEIQKHIDKRFNELREHVSAALVAIEKSVKERMDDFESEYVAKSLAVTPTGDPASDHSAEIVKQIRSLIQ